MWQTLNESQEKGRWMVGTRKECTGEWMKTTSAQRPGSQPIGRGHSNGRAFWLALSGCLPQWRVNNRPLSAAAVDGKNSVTSRKKKQTNQLQRWCDQMQLLLDVNGYNLMTLHVVGESRADSSIGDPDVKNECLTITKWRINLPKGISL